MNAESWLPDPERRHGLWQCVFTEHRSGRAEGRRVHSVWREVFLEVTGLNLEGSFWRGSGQWSMAGNPGLFKVVWRQEAQPGQKVGQCGDVR